MFGDNHCVIGFDASDHCLHQAHAKTRARIGNSEKIFVCPGGLWRRVCASGNCRSAANTTKRTSRARATCAKLSGRGAGDAELQEQVARLPADEEPGSFLRKRAAGAFATSLGDGGEDKAERDAKLMLARLFPKQS